MNHDHSATGYSPFYLSYGYHPRTPRLFLARTATKRRQTAQQWASTLASRLKIVHSGAVTRDLQAKQRRVAGCPQEPSPLHVGDSVMMYAPPRPAFPTKLQSCWQGPFIVVKCLEGTTLKVFGKGFCDTVINFVYFIHAQNGYNPLAVRTLLALSL